MNRKGKLVKLIVSLTIILCVVVFSVLYARSYGYADALISAIANDDIKKVDSLLKMPGDANSYSSMSLSLVDSCRFGGYYPTTPLMAACYDNNFEAVKKLVEVGGANVNKGNSLLTPLRETIINGTSQPYDTTLDIANYLIDRGADVFYACSYDEDDTIVETIFDDLFSYSRAYASLSDWWSHVEEKEYELFLRLVEMGVPVETSRFLQSASSERIKIMEYLIEEKGFDVNVIGGVGITALISAARSYSPTVLSVEYLLSKGADKSIKDNEGKTALDWAIEKGHNEIIALLQD